MSLSSSIRVVPLSTEVIMLCSATTSLFLFAFCCRVEKEEVPSRVSFSSPEILLIRPGVPSGKVFSDKKSVCVSGIISAFCASPRLSRSNACAVDTLLTAFSAETMRFALPLFPSCTGIFTGFALVGISPDSKLFVPACPFGAPEKLSGFRTSLGNGVVDAITTVSVLKPAILACSR